MCGLRTHITGAQKTEFAVRDLNMKKTRAIIIAAGLGSRLRPLTDNTPKCMLEVNGKPLIRHCIDNLQENNVEKISIVTGYKSKKINFEGVDYFHNSNFLNNNILHSLFYARAALESALEDNVSVLISYSDIWFHPSIVGSLIKCTGKINIVVDTDWESGYDGRTDHPVSEAELAVYTPENRLTAIGKNLIDASGEFIGLFMLQPAGIDIFLKHFDKINATTSLVTPFGKADEWQKSYITDILQDMVDHDIEVNCLDIEGRWREFDTVQDFNRGIPD